MGRKKNTEIWAALGLATAGVALLAGLGWKLLNAAAGKGEPAAPPAPQPEKTEPPAPEPAAENTAQAAEPAPQPQPVPRGALRAFYCFAWLPDEAASGPRFYELSARQTGEGAECLLRKLREERSFTAAPAFLEKLDRLSDAWRLPSFDGLCREERGGNGQKGATLELEYASGKRVYAYDNEQMFLPELALQALVTAFEEEGSGK